MAKLKVTDFLVYKWRYTLGSLAIGIILLTVLFIAGYLIPGGLANTEMASAVKSSKLNVSPDLIREPEMLMHLPYHLLQKLSLAILGVTTAAIKLPSLVLGFTSALFLFGVLNLWFKRNVAVITTIIVATSSSFLLQSQLGTPEIVYLFWTSCLLFCSSMLTQSFKFKPLWTLTSAAVAGLSLYSPYAIYAVIALSATVLIHPHARFVVFRQSKLILALAVAILLLLATPLILGSIQSLEFLRTMVGVPDTLPTINTVFSSLQGYVNFNSPSAGILATPVYGLVVSLLVIIGLFRLFTAKYTAKSYILTIWLAFVVLLIGLSDAPAALTFVPVMLVVAFAIDYLIRSWYGLFPRNPYARITGLFPLGVLLLGITINGISYYVLSYRYAPEASASYSKDLSIVRSAISKNTGAPIVLLVESEDLSFYTLYANSVSPMVTVTTAKPTASAKSSFATVIASREMRSDTIKPTRIIVNDTAQNADRFYLYKNGYF